MLLTITNQSNITGLYLTYANQTDLNSIKSSLKNDSNKIKFLKSLLYYLQFAFIICNL